MGDKDNRTGPNCRSQPLQASSTPSAVAKSASSTPRTISLQNRTNHDPRTRNHRWKLEPGLPPARHRTWRRQPPAKLRDDARTRLSQWVLSNHVRVEATSLTEQRTGLGVLHVGATNVNAALVEAGLARVNRNYLKGLPLDQLYAILRAESIARPLEAVNSTVPGGSPRFQNLDRRSSAIPSPGRHRPISRNGGPRGI